MQYDENLMTRHGSGMKLAGDKSYHFQTEAAKIWWNFIDPWRENWVISEAACGQKIQQPAKHAFHLENISEKSVNTAKDSCFMSSN